MRPEEVFQEIYALMRYGSTITGIVELAGVSTIQTDNLHSLQEGQFVEIGSRVYQVSNIITGAFKSFDITGTNITATEWNLALYYEYGRALEINATMKDKKDDPINKNKRFPLMWLLTDIAKDYNYEIGYQADILIAFVYLSEENLKTKKRIETKLEPILDPLVELFKEKITSGIGRRYFIYPFGTNLELIETDKFLYGSVDGNQHVFDDITDAIQINMNLRFNANEQDCIT